VIALATKYPISLPVPATYFIGRSTWSEVIDDGDHILGGKEQAFERIFRAVPGAGQVLAGKTWSKVLLYQGSQLRLEYTACASQVTAKITIAQHDTPDGREKWHNKAVFTESQYPQAGLNRFNERLTLWRIRKATPL